MEDMSGKQHLTNRLLMDGIDKELRELYSKEFNIDDIDKECNTYSKFTPEQQIERYARDVAFWMKLLKEHNNEV